jgi:hypothetical protein
LLAREERLPGLPKTRDFRACQRQGTSGIAKDQGFQGLPETDCMACRRPWGFQILPETRHFRLTRDPDTSGLARNQRFQDLAETRFVTDHGIIGFVRDQRFQYLCRDQLGISVFVRDKGFQGLPETRDFRSYRRPGISDLTGD